MLRLYLYARVRFVLCTLHARPRVQQAPGVPCALFLMGETICKARAKRAAGVRRCVLWLLRETKNAAALRGLRYATAPQGDGYERASSLRNGFAVVAGGASLLRASKDGAGS